MNELERDLIAVQFLASNFEKQKFWRFSKISTETCKIRVRPGQGSFKDPVHYAGKLGGAVQLPPVWFSS